MNRNLAWVVALICGCAGAGRGVAPMPAAAAEPTTVYVALRIRTLDPARPLAEAIAVRGGKIVAVGSRAELVKPGARVVELGEATIVPGLEDAHGHLLSLGRALGTVNLVGTRSVGEAVERVRAAPASSYLGDWLIGRGWDQNDWTGAFPERSSLEAVSAARPIAMTRIDGHAIWVNGEALRRAGISRGTKDPEGGRILRDAAGEPTGVLIDNAMDLVTAKIPEPTEAERSGWLRAALQKCAAVGLTAVHDAGMDVPTFELLKRWDAAGELPLRIYVMADGQNAADAFLAMGKYEGRHLTLRAVKLYADGALGSRGAAMHAPYSDEHTQTGLLLISPEELERRAKAFMAKGFQVNVHAIGDRANTLAIDVLGRAAKETGTVGLRHRIEHLQIVRLEDLPRMKAAGLVASMQPTHATSDMPWAEQRVGKERIAGAYAWRSVLDAGIPLAFGSDFPIELPDPLHGLYSARTRQDPQGQPPGGWMPEQRLTGEEALRAFTIGAAYASFAEDRRGLLAVGRDADFVALSEDPVDGDPLRVRDAKVLLNVVDGAPVFPAAK